MILLVNRVSTLRGRQTLLALAAMTAATLLAAPTAGTAHEARAGSSGASASQPAGTLTLGPATLATSNTTTLQNHPTCISQGCTFIQWSGAGADSSYASTVNGTIVAWRIASGSAGNKVKLRVLRPAGGGRYSAVASSPTETTSGGSSSPDQFDANIPVKAGDVIGLDNSNSALIFKTGVLGAFPEFWTPVLSDGGSPSAPSPPVGTTSNGYQIQIDAYVRPAATTTSTTTTTTPATTTTTVTTTTTTATTTAAAPTDTSLSVSHVRVSAVWKTSRLNGKVRFSVSVRGASRLTAVLRATAGGRTRGGRTYATNRAGTFPEVLRLQPGTPPGSYILRVRATTGTSRPAVRNSTLVLRPPREGVVDRATISVEKNGADVASVRAPQKELWVRFHFAALPAKGRARIVWRTPRLKLVGAVTKPAATTTDSFIRSNAPLAPGRWYAILSVDGVVVKRAGVRVT